MWSRAGCSNWRRLWTVLNPESLARNICLVIIVRAGHVSKVLQSGHHVLQSSCESRSTKTIRQTCGLSRHSLAHGNTPTLQHSISCFGGMSSEQLHQILFFGSVVFLAYSCYLWIGLGPGAIWMGIALRLTAIHVLLLYKKVNFRAVCPGHCLKRQRPRQKWIGLQDGLQPRWDRQWLGCKWMRWLTVSHIFSNAPSCLCANIIPPRIERPLVTRFSLLYRSPLLFPSRNRMRRSWLVSIFWLLTFLLHQLIHVVFCFSPGEVTAQKWRLPRHRGQQGHNSASEKESRQAARNRHVLIFLLLPCHLS